MKKVNSYVLGFSIAMSATVLIFLSFVISLFISSQKFSNQLENVYKESLYQLVQNVDDLQVDMSKFVATTSQPMQREILTNIRTLCTLAVGNLNVLPMAQNKTTNINKFFNLVSGYSQSLIDKINSNIDISSVEYKNFESLFDQCNNIYYDLNNFVASTSYDYRVLSEVKFSSADDSVFSAGIASGDNPESELPTLIFDGPFAESVIAKNINGLSMNYLTKEECDEKVQDLLKYFEGYSFEYSGETNSKFETFNYVLSKDGHRLYVQITKRDGLLLNITSYGAGGGENITLDDAGDLSLECALNFGFENMEVVWGMENGNIAYVNLAPVVNDVVYYPDLIKVKVDKRLGVVVGWDAVNYAYNHVERSEFVSAYGILEGEASLSPLLEVELKRKVLIPNKYSGEVFAYEYVCKWNDYTYYIYLDSQTGEEVKIMRMISTNTGDLLL